MITLEPSAAAAPSAPATAAPPPRVATTAEATTAVATTAEATTLAPARPPAGEPLTRRAAAIANLTPNWFAAVMGTGIVAVAGAGLPYQPPGLHTAALVVWMLAAALLVTLLAGTLLHWCRHPRTAREHANDPIMAYFYGAAPMALLTVGAGTLLLGRDLIGLRAAIDVDWVLWFAGTAGGLLCAAAVPYLAITRHSPAIRPGGAAGGAFGGWLMPVVPPMVSASTGALLVPHTASGQPRLTLVLACYAMFGLSLIASLVIIVAIWQRLVRDGVGEARLIPTLWIVLGPLGQSITAVNLLAGVVVGVLPAPYAPALRAFAVLYGVPVLGFALLWAGLAAALTLRAARDRLPFALTWWSFTFPVGTCVTGLTGLAAHTGAEVFRVAAGLGYLALVAAWLMVAARTLKGCYTGALFSPPR